jgi:hypothetical protein
VCVVSKCPVFPSPDNGIAWYSRRSAGLTPPGPYTVTTGEATAMPVPSGRRVEAEPVSIHAETGVVVVYSPLLA